jgi:2-oxoglutarate dehydrogenase E1 component
VLTEAARLPLHEVVIGMAAPGRLNVLANIVGKSYAQIFGEFEGNLDPRTTHGSGDVKYHLGATACSPPRRLEDRHLAGGQPEPPGGGRPGAGGVVRAKQDVLDMGEPGFTVLPVLDPRRRRRSRARAWWPRR